MSKIEKIIKITRKYLTRYDYEKVEKCCDRILELDPESWWGLKYKGISRYQREKYEEAIPVYQQHHLLYPNDEDTKVTLIEMYEELGRYEEALQLYPKIIKIDDNYNKQKRLLSKMREYQNIIDEYDKQLKSLEIIEQTPDTIKRKIVLLEEKGIYLYRNEEYDKAYSIFQEVSELYPQIKDTLAYKEQLDPWYSMLSQYLQKYPVEEFFQKLLSTKNTEIWCKKLENKLSQYEDPLVFSDILLEKNSDNTEILETVGRISRYVDRTYSLKCWKRILEIDPENITAIKTILAIYSQEYSKDRSLKLIDSKLYIDEIKIDLMVRKIRILESMTLYDEALEAYDEYFRQEIPEGISNNPLNIFDKLRCMEQKAIDLYLENKFDESFDTYKEVDLTFGNVTRSPTRIGSDEWKLEGWYKEVLHKSMEKSGNNPKAFFEEFFTLNRENIPLWVDKINFLTFWKYFGNPINYCNILLNKNSRNCKILLAKATVYHMTKRLTKALALYNTILDDNPDNIEVLAKKFNVLVNLGEYDEAVPIVFKLKDSKNIKFYLKELARERQEKEKYDEALYCYKLLLKEGYDSEIICYIKDIWNKTKDRNSQNKSIYYMDWINTIKFKHEEYACPECGGKLIPIKYGLMPITEENEKKIGNNYVLGGCCVSIDSPTDYCKKCEKAVIMGIYRIEIEQENHELYIYTREKIIWITEILENTSEKSVNELEKEIYEKFCIDKREFEKFLEKLEDIKHIKKEGQKIKLV